MLVMTDISSVRKGSPQSFGDPHGRLPTPESGDWLRGGPGHDEPTQPLALDSVASIETIAAWDCCIEHFEDLVN